MQEHDQKEDQIIWEVVHLWIFTDTRNKQETIQKQKAEIVAQMLRTLENLDSNAGNEALADCVRGFAEEIQKITSKHEKLQKR